MNFQISFTLFLITCGLFLGSRIATLNYEAGALKQAITKVEDQQETQHQNLGQLKDLETQREEMVTQAKEIEKQYTNLINDILVLAKEDDDAKEIVKKWNIQSN